MEINNNKKNYDKLRVPSIRIRFYQTGKEIRLSVRQVSRFVCPAYTFLIVFRCKNYRVLVSESTLHRDNRINGGVYPEGSKTRRRRICIGVGNGPSFSTPPMPILRVRFGFLKCSHATIETIVFIARR